MVEKNKKTETNEKDENKLKELKIELLKQGSKKRNVKREIAKILTLQKNKMEVTSKLPRSPSVKETKK